MTPRLLDLIGKYVESPTIYPGYGYCLTHEEFENIALAYRRELEPAVDGSEGAGEVADG